MPCSLLNYCYYGKREVIMLISRITTTFRIPRLLKKNLAAYSAQYCRSENEIIVDAISTFLTRRGVDINKSPKFFKKKIRKP